MISAFAVNAVGADEAAVTEWVDRHLAGGRLVRARLSELVVKDSPRASEHDPRHARVLADLDGELPPIVVHEPTMRVIDGAHRVRAAQLRGDFDIAARLVQVPEADAFALAVRLNVSHGLPLMRSDRVAAAHRLLETHPFWSDRRIAVLVGMSAGTVAAYRRRSIAQSAQSAQIARSNRRIGLDGRSRPVNGAEGRLRAAQLIAERPARC